MKGYYIYILQKEYINTKLKKKIYSNYYRRYAKFSENYFLYKNI